MYLYHYYGISKLDGAISHRCGNVFIGYKIKNRETYNKFIDELTNCINVPKDVFILCNYQLIGIEKK